MRWKETIILFVVISALAGCGGSAPLQPSLTSIIIAPTTASYTLPATQQFTATGKYSDGSSQDITQSVTWSSSDTSVATISNSAGTQGMARMVGSGTSDIGAAMGSVMASVTVKVTSSVSVSVSPTFADVVVTHQTQTFTATVQGTTNTAVTWAVDGVDGGNSTDGTISSSGVYTPPSTAGMHKITATSQADLSKASSAQVAVTDDPGVYTRRYNNARTGLNSDEIVLTPQNVNVQQFGKIATYPVQGLIYAQPLYVANVNLPKLGYRNVVYVATTDDIVYAFDADGKSPGLIWQANLLNTSSGETAVPCIDEADACTFFGPEIGITGTPVIDPSTGTLYVETFSTIGGTVFYHKLHALDITTGAEKFGGPVILQGSVLGTGQGGNGTTVAFDPGLQLQRSGLLLANGLVYIAFASFSDYPPFHGWIFAYDAKTLSKAAVFNDTPNGGDGGIWQGGGGLAADSSGNVYVMTGNGTFDANTGGPDYGDSFIKLSPKLSVEDYFTPYNQATLDAGDTDLGSGGPVLLPDQSGPYPHLMIGGGKQGVLYLVNRDNLGHYNSANNDQIVQTVSNQVASLFGSAAYWNGNLYFEGYGSPLERFTISNGLLSTTPASQGQYVGPFPGLTPVVSANKTQDAIVWAIETASQSNEPAVLRAYDATDLSTELYDSNQAANSRDVPGDMIKFQVPVVVNGRVYVGTNGELDIYGLLPQ